MDSVEVLETITLKVTLQLTRVRTVPSLDASQDDLHSLMRENITEADLIALEEKGFAYAPGSRRVLISEARSTLIPPTLQP